MTKKASSRHENITKIWVKRILKILHKNKMAVTNSVDIKFTHFPPHCAVLEVQMQSFSFYPYPVISQDVFKDLNPL